MSERVINRVKEHFNTKENKVIEVPEWGEGDDSLFIHVTPMTLAQKNRLYKMAKDDDLALMVEALILKAKDEEGNQIFSRADKPDLMRKADPDIVGRVAMEIMGEGDFEDVEKNSEETPNS